MKAPDKIYVAESDKIVGHIEHHIFSESPFQRHSSIEYIRKEALLEWANNWEKIGVSDDFAYAIQTLIKHIESP